MREDVVRAGGLALAVGYTAFITWLYVTQPQNIAEVACGLAADIGVSKFDCRAFEDGLDLFRHDEFAAARNEFANADPARSDPVTQLYIAYSHYREGCGLLAHDNEQFERGLEAVDHAIALTPGGRLVVDDASLGLQTADMLKAALEAGLSVSLDDFNPLRLFRQCQ